MANAPFSPEYLLNEITKDQDLQALVLQEADRISKQLTQAQGGSRAEQTKSIEKAFTDSGYVDLILGDGATEATRQSLHSDFRDLVVSLSGGARSQTQPTVQFSRQTPSVSGSKRLRGEYIPNISDAPNLTRRQPPPLASISFRIETNRRPDDPRFHFIEIEDIMDITFDECTRSRSELKPWDISLTKLRSAAAADSRLRFKPDKYEFWVEDAHGHVRRIGQQDELTNAIAELLDFGSGPNSNYLTILFAASDKIDAILDQQKNIPWMHPPLGTIRQTGTGDTQEEGNPNLKTSDNPEGSARDPPSSKSPKTQQPEGTGEGEKARKEKENTSIEVIEISEDDEDETERDNFILQHQPKFPNQVYDRTRARRRDNQIKVQKIDFAGVDVDVKENEGLSHSTKQLSQDNQDSDSDDEDDDASQDVDNDLQQIISRAENHTDEMIQLTEAVFGLDPEEKKRKSGPKVAGLKTHLYKYQAIGMVFAAQVMKKYRLCFQADDMGLGKTIQAIAFIVSQYNFNRRTEDMKQNPSNHCSDESSTCPTHQRSWPRCPCEGQRGDSDLTSVHKIFKYRPGITLIVVSSNAVGTWIDEFKKTCKLKELGLKIWVAHAATKLTPEDANVGIQAYTESVARTFCSPLKDGVWDEIKRLYENIVITTRQSIRSRFLDFIPHTSARPSANTHALEVGTIINDEAHELKDIRVGFNKIMRADLDGYPYILSVSGTPLLSGTNDLVSPMWAAQTRYRTRIEHGAKEGDAAEEDSSDDDAKEESDIPVDLKADTVEKRATQLTKYYRKGKKIGPDELEEYRDVQATTQKVIQQFMLRRTPESTLHNQRCSSKPPHFAYDIICKRPKLDEIYKLMKSEGKALIHKIGQKRQAQLALSDPSRATKNVFKLDELRIERITAAFPFLYKVMKEEGEFDLLARSAYDLWEEWEARKTNCEFYKKWGTLLCDPKANPKLIPLRHIIENESESKAILFSFHAWPLVLAAIYIEVQFKLTVRLLVPGIQGAVKKGFEYRFNDPKTEETLANGIAAFDIIGGIKATMGTGLSLTGTATVIQLGPEWKHGEEAQEVMRVNRPDVVQRHEFTRSYRILMPENLVENMIVEKQKQQKDFQQLCLEIYLHDLSEEE